MIVKLSKACQQYNVQELCDLFDHARSSYYYQSKDKPITNSTKSIIKSMKQISIETGHTYGRRRLKLQLNADGFRVGTHRIKTLMKMANIKVIKPKNVIIIPILSSYIKEPTIYLIVTLIKQIVILIG